jgi:ankyrin repeat protein
MTEQFIEQLITAINANDISFFKENESRIEWDYCFPEYDNCSLILYALGCSSEEGESAVQSIVYSGDVKKLVKYVARYNLDINSRSNDGTSPLLSAILLERFRIVDRLLRYHDIDVNAPDNENISPIHMACMLGYEDIVRKLVAKGVNLSAKTDKGNLPIALAINEGHDSIVRYLYNKIYN